MLLVALTAVDVQVALSILSNGHLEKCEINTIRENNTFFKSNSNFKYFFQYGKKKERIKIWLDRKVVLNLRSNQVLAVLIFELPGERGDSAWSEDECLLVRLQVAIDRHLALVRERHPGHFWKLAK